VRRLFQVDGGLEPGGDVALRQAPAGDIVRTRRGRRVSAARTVLDPPGVPESRLTSAQFLACRHALVTTLGVEPGEESSALQRRLLTGEPV